MDYINLTLTPEQIGVMMVMVISITQGIKATFKITNSKTIRLIHMLVVLWLFTAFNFDNYLLGLINTFIVIWLGTSGIFDFLPPSIKSNLENMLKGSE